MKSTINQLPEPKIKNKKKGKIIKTAALSLLMLQSINAASVSAHQDNVQKKGTHQTEIVTKEKKHTVPKDTKEFVEINEEHLFRGAVSQAIRPINSLKNIPVGGIQLKYPQTYTGDLPKSIDFFPKEIKAETLPYTIIRIGEKMFVVTPDLGFVVDKMYLDKDNFYVHVVEQVWGVTILGKEISKSKEDKEKGLPEYLAKLYFKGTTVKYTLSTVREVPKAYQAQALKALEKLNVKKTD